MVRTGIVNKVPPFSFRLAGLATLSSLGRQIASRLLPYEEKPVLAETELKTEKQNGVIVTTEKSIWFAEEYLIIQIAAGLKSNESEYCHDIALPKRIVSFTKFDYT